MAVVTPTIENSNMPNSDVYWNSVAGAVQAIAFPPGVKAAAFVSSGSGVGATLTITLS